MADRHLYGRTLSVKFFPQAEDEDVDAYELVSARLYPVNTYPSENQQKNLESGDIREETDWTAIADKGFRVDFDALTDDEPTSTREYEIYYVVFNYKLEDGGETVFDVEQIQVYRPDSHTTKIEVEPEDIFKLEPRLSEICDAQEIYDAIEVAIEEVVAMLEALGYPKNRVFNWQKLNLATARKATEKLCDNAASEGNQFWERKARGWEKSFTRHFDSAKVGFDISGQDRPGPEEQVSTGPVYVER